MAKLILACWRDGAPHLSPDDAGRLCARVVPDNISPRPPRIYFEGGLIVAVVNPWPGLPANGASVCLGQMLGGEDWHRPGAAAPDGSYAICRADGGCVELITDVAGSRTLWYCRTDELFAASTSQRALVALLGSYQFDARAVPWMLSSGTLGPEAGWDARLRRLGPDSRLLFDRDRWTVSLEEQPVAFKPVHRTALIHRRALQQALESTCERLDSLGDDWRLPLSGGVDSRALLVLLRRGAKPRCITWGRQAAIEEPGNDAFVARKLAERLGVEHEYFALDLSNEPVETLVERFLVAGEGRVDHISGYMDGFEIWRRLFDAGVAGIIRGDEGFGWLSVASETQVRYELGAMFLADYFSAQELAALGLPPQTWPAGLERQRGESLATWRDRLYHQFRIPIVLAALNDLKSAYVEIANPLLSRRIIETVREMPDRLRTDKRLFRRLVRSMSPAIPYARHAAIVEPKHIFGSEPFRRFMGQELRSAEAQELLPEGLRAYLLARVERPARPASTAKTSMAALLKRVLPPAVVAQIKRLAPGRRPVLDANVLAFRACLISRMARLLAKDAKALARS